jgi:hypothetical protein
MFDDLLGSERKGVRKPMAGDEQFEDILEATGPQTGSAQPEPDTFDTGQPEKPPKYWSTGQKPDVWRTKP